MAGVGGEEAVKKLYSAAVEGDVNTIHQLLQRDPYLLHLASFPCSRNLLHVAAMHGQVGIVQEIMRRNPQLSQDLDSQKRSPLHIAAAIGHVDIASELLSSACDMLWSRDSQGMNPVHVAAMHGHAKMLKKLVKSDPVPAKERAGRGYTALHLCVKHGHMDALKVLVDKMEELVLAKDDDGETLLHLAIRCKRSHMIQYVMTLKKVEKKARNSKGESAFDIFRKSYDDKTSSLEEVKYIKEIRKALLGHTGLNARIEFTRKMSDTTMVVVVLIATMAYQSAVSPPGGVWQDNSSSHRVGEAVMASYHPGLYKKFVGANTTAFISSLFSIFLLSTGLPSKDLWILLAVVPGVWVSLAAIAVSFGASLIMTTPYTVPQSLDQVISIVVGVTIGLFVLLLIWLAFGPSIKRVTRKPRSVCIDFLHSKNVLLKDRTLEEVRGGTQ